MKLYTDKLDKFYGRRKVVDGMSIQVEQGEIVGLLGPNGAGKTTTFYMVVGFIKPTEGHVYLPSDVQTRAARYRIPTSGSLSVQKNDSRGQHCIGSRNDQIEPQRAKGETRRAD